MDQFASFVAYAPPGSALFHERNRGWTTGDYLTAQAVDALSYLAWAKTKDAHSKNPKHMPKPIPRPVFPQRGQQPAPAPAAESTERMTVEEYVKRSGIAFNLEGR